MTTYFYGGKLEDEPASKPRCLLNSFVRLVFAKCYKKLVEGEFFGEENFHSFFFEASCLIL